jgi:hypothetical protein
VAAWRENLPPPVQLATNESSVADLLPFPVVIDARIARPVQKTLMHSNTLWNGIFPCLVMLITHY